MQFLTIQKTLTMLNLLTLSNSFMTFFFYLQMITLAITALSHFDAIQFDTLQSKCWAAIFLLSHYRRFFLIADFFLVLLVLVMLGL